MLESLQLSKRKGMRIIPSYENEELESEAILFVKKGFHRDQRRGDRYKP
jgi:hypothetical protein